MTSQANRLLLLLLRCCQEVIITTPHIDHLLILHHPDWCHHLCEDIISTSRHGQGKGGNTHTKQSTKNWGTKNNPHIWSYLALESSRIIHCEVNFVRWPQHWIILMCFAFKPREGASIFSKRHWAAFNKSFKSFLGSAGFFAMSFFILETYLHGLLDISSIGSKNTLVC